MQAELSNALVEAKRLLNQHRSALDEVARRLLRDRKIDGIEVGRILEASAAAELQVPHLDADLRRDDPESGGHRMIETQAP